MEYGVIRTATGDDTHVARLTVVDGVTKIDGVAECGTYQVYVGSAMDEGTPVTCLHCQERLPQVVAQLGFQDTPFKKHRTRADIKHESRVKLFEAQIEKGRKVIARAEKKLANPKSADWEIFGANYDIKDALGSIARAEKALRKLSLGPDYLEAVSLRNSYVKQLDRMSRLNRTHGFYSDSELALVQKRVDEAGKKVEEMER